MLTSIFFRRSIVSLFGLISAYLSLLHLGRLVCTHDFYWNFIVFVYAVCILLSALDKASFQVHMYRSVADVIKVSSSLVPN